MLIVLKSGVIINLANVLLIGTDRVVLSVHGERRQLSVEDYENLREILEAGMRQARDQANGRGILVPRVTP